MWRQERKGLSTDLKGQFSPYRKPRPNRVFEVNTSCLFFYYRKIFDIAVFHAETLDSTYEPAVQKYTSYKCDSDKK